MLWHAKIEEGRGVPDRHVFIEGNREPTVDDVFTIANVHPVRGEPYPCVAFVRSVVVHRLVNDACCALQADTGWCNCAAFAPKSVERKCVTCGADLRVLAAAAGVSLDPLATYCGPECDPSEED